MQTRLTWHLRRLLVALFAAMAPVIAHGQDFAFNHLNVDGGLSAGKVNALVQDTRGFIWIGTVDGLNRFDGYDVTEFRHVEGDSTSLSDNVVLFLHEDTNGFIWVGTSDGGLNRFDPVTETFYRYAHDPEDPDSLPSNEVLAIAEDNNGNIWIGTGDGLGRYDPERDGFVNYRHDTNNAGSLSHDVAQALYVDRAGVLWVGTMDGLNRYDANSDSFSTFRSAENPIVNGVSVIEGREQGGFWIGTFGAGLQIFDRTTTAFTPAPLEGAFGSTIIVSLFEDSEGALWVGTGGDGLHRRDPMGDQSAYRFDPASSNSLNDNFVRFVIRDRQGIVWAATYNGLDWFDPARSTFVTYQHTPTQPT
ncbi:MAG: two-component regulator propeller domain-containing protein, partial [Rubricoccaceae bacterium]|nr:two-component regulator propeller domain-containing protein [Rubricoccaceae bacterium]